jgi:hypothetical protein
MSFVEIKAYMAYCYTILRVLVNMNTGFENEEIRWKVIKAMLEDFPNLKKRVKRYLEKKER